MLGASLPRHKVNQMEKEYLSATHSAFDATLREQTIFDNIIHRPSSARPAILQSLKVLIPAKGLAYALLALYRQQVNCGFVLADPLNPTGKESKVFLDPHTGIEFQVMWNPDRELRGNRELLIERGVMAPKVDKEKLIHRDRDGRACFLCAHNIAFQNPAEILLPMQLGGKAYYAGANFAYLANNHFTVMSAEHHSQEYGPQILAAMTDLVNRTDGHFRAIFNGLGAGASIPWHEHLQITTEPFPIEHIRIRPSDVVRSLGNVQVSTPFYYLSVWTVEGRSSQAVEHEAHRIAARWHRADPAHHTLNIIATKQNEAFRLFLFPRDSRKRAGTGKAGTMASYECGGTLILSYIPKPGQPNQTNERKTFDAATLETVKALLAQIAPPRRAA